MNTLNNNKKENTGKENQVENNKNVDKKKKYDFLINNFGLKIMAVCMAFLTWFMVVNAEDPMTSRMISGVKVDILNRETLVNANQVVRVLQDSNKEYTNVTTVRVTGRSSTINKLSAEDFVAKADLKELRAEPYASTESVPIQIKCKNADVRLENVKCSPASLQVSIEDGVEKTFAVNVDKTGEPESGYEIGATHIREGDTVLIWGAKDVVNKIKRVELEVDVEGSSQSTSFTSEYIIYDKNEDAMSDSVLENIRIKNSAGTVITESKVSVTLWPVQSMKLELQTTGRPAYGYRIGDIITVNETISLAGAPSTMEELDGVLTIPEPISVDAASQTVKGSIDLEKILAKDFEGKLILERNEVSTINYEVQVEKIGTTTISFPVKDMTVRGAPEGMDISLTPADKISIEVQAESEEKPIITADMIRATLDLSNYKKEATYRAVPVMITLPEGYELVHDVTIAVNLKNAANVAVDGEE